VWATTYTDNSHISSCITVNNIASTDNKDHVLLVVSCNNVKIMYLRSKTCCFHLASMTECKFTDTALRWSFTAWWDPLLNNHYYMYFFILRSINKSSTPQIRTGRPHGNCSSGSAVVINPLVSTGEERTCEVRQYPFAPRFESGMYRLYCIMFCYFCFFVLDCSRYQLSQAAE
jgi:hypothetical protein